MKLRTVVRTMAATRKEAEHARFVDMRKEEEERRARHDMRRRANRKSNLCQTFQCRRYQNFLKEDEIVVCKREPPPPPPPLPTPRRQREQHHCQRHSNVPKDWAFYNKTGFIWSDLGRTPKARLSTVVPPIAVKREREFIDRLLETVKEEAREARDQATEQRERVAAQRESLRQKISLRKMVHSQDFWARPEISRSDNELTKVVDTSGLRTQPLVSKGAERRNKRRVILSQRHEELARPEKSRDIVRSFVTSGSVDLVGLLHGNPALKGFLRWHLDNLREDIRIPHSGSLSKKRHACSLVPPRAARPQTA